MRYSNLLAYRVNGVSGISLDVPDSTESAAVFERFFEHMRTHAGVELADVDAFAAAADNWGTSAINGRYGEAAQLQAERAYQRLYVLFAKDAYAKLMLDQAKGVLDSVRKTVAESAKNSVSANRETAAVAGAGFGLIIAVGIGIYLLAKG